MSHIPLLFVTHPNLAGAWEQAVLKCWNEGIEIKTEYDKESDPPSRDCTMAIHVQNPFNEPRIHRAFPGGLEDLEVYRQEVIEGIHDHWMEVEGGWNYTYHQRLCKYPTNDLDWTANQIDFIVDKLTETPYTRRAQGITWIVGDDIYIDDPPCLQRVWCRMTKDDEDNLYLNMNTHWRSRDGYKAAYMNMFALTALQAKIADDISEKMGKEVFVGSYSDISDSFHIYGSYFDEFKGFLSTMEHRTFEGRTWNSEFAEPMFLEARERLAKE